MTLPSNTKPQGIGLGSVLFYYVLILVFFGFPALNGAGDGVTAPLVAFLCLSFPASLLTLILPELRGDLRSLLILVMLPTLNALFFYALFRWIRNRRQRKLAAIERREPTPDR